MIGSKFRAQVTTGSQFVLGEHVENNGHSLAMRQTKKVIARIKGGLGNQLFCYAAARRLALANEAELALDHVTGFVRDRQHLRQYQLDHFLIQARKATPTERMEPLERARRGFAKWLAGKRPFSQRQYLEQIGQDFDDRLLELGVRKTLYLDGLWQSERYFKDVEHVIREDLRIIPPTDPVNQRLAEDIRDANAVALHVRWFDARGGCAAHNVAIDYYRRAMSIVERRLEAPHFFLFSDDPDAARSLLALPEKRLSVVTQNRGDENAYADLWLMSLCRHFITANSTFSWWGAWLGRWEGKIVVTPQLQCEGNGAWGFKGLIPSSWVST